MLIRYSRELGTIKSYFPDFERNFCKNGSWFYLRSLTKIFTRPIYIIVIPGSANTQSSTSELWVLYEATGNLSSLTLQPDWTITFPLTNKNFLEQHWVLTKIWKCLTMLWNWVIKTLKSISRYFNLTIFFFCKKNRKFFFFSF